MSHEFQEPPIGGSPGAGCPDAERLASYLDGRLGAAERAEIEVHIERCETCAEVVSAVAVYQATEAGVTSTEPSAAEDDFRPRSLLASDVRPVEDERETTQGPHWWGTWKVWVPSTAAAAAAVMLVMRLLPGVAVRTPALQVALNQLDASVSEFRPVEARMTGFSYHPLAPVFRSAPAVTDRPGVTGGPGVADVPFAVREAAIEVEKAAVAADPKDVEAQRALAKMYLVLEQPDRAVETLTPFIAGSADSALLTDYSATLLARRGPNDASQALDAAERAVRTNPQSPEAWFNVGLAAEALDLTERAREAWTRYLELDASSGWAGEARKHLEDLNRVSWLSSSQVFRHVYELA